MVGIASPDADDRPVASTAPAGRRHRPRPVGRGRSFRLGRKRQHEQSRGGPRREPERPSLGGPDCRVALNARASGLEHPTPGQAWDLRRRLTSVSRSVSTPDPSQSSSGLQADAGGSSSMGSSGRQPRIPRMAGLRMSSGRTYAAAQKRTVRPGGSSSASWDQLGERMLTSSGFAAAAELTQHELPAPTLGDAAPACPEQRLPRPLSSGRLRPECES
jgi:hypothetical protein